MISRSIGVPLSVVRPPPYRLLKVARDIIVTLKRLHKAGILHHDILINNIMCTLKKGKHIVLENGASITAKSSTLLASEKNSGLEAFLNDYDLATYAAKVSGMKKLTYGHLGIHCPKPVIKLGRSPCPPRRCLCNTLCNLDGVY